MKLAFISGVTVFQFTLPRGERQPASVWLSTTGGFQFTLPRGERRGQPYCAD